MCVDLVSDQLCTLRRLPVSDATDVPNALEHPRNIFSLVTCVDEDFEAIGIFEQAGQVFRGNVRLLDSLINNVSSKLRQGTEAAISLDYHIFAWIVLQLPDDDAIHEQKAIPQNTVV